MSTVQFLKVRRYFVMFTILLLWPSVIEAGIPKHLLSKFSIKVSNKKEFLYTLNRLIDDLDIQESISKNDLEIFARAFDDPAQLIDDNLQSVSGNNTDGFIRTSYDMGRSRTHWVDDNSDLYKLYEAFFFSRFDLKMHSDSFFKEFFPQESSDVDAFMGKLKNLFKGVEEAKQRGYTQIDPVDLAAATIIALCRHECGNGVMRNFTMLGQRVLDLEIIGFIENHFKHLEYYMSPYFTFSPRSRYHQEIVDKVLSDGSNLNTKEAILKIWGDIKRSKVVESDPDHSYTHKDYDERISILQEHVRNSIGEVVNGQTIRNVGEYTEHLENSSFLRMLMQARREDESLNEIVSDVIGDFYGSNATMPYYPYMQFLGRESADRFRRNVSY